MYSHKPENKNQTIYNYIRNPYLQLYQIDFSALYDRNRFVGEAYIMNTTDMYTPGMTLPAVFGASAPKGNYADLKTTCWEASLSWRDKFNISSSPFHYEFRVTLADNKSIITKYNNPEKVLTDYYEGQEIGEIWGYVTEGFFVDDEDIATHATQALFKNTSSGANFPGDLKLLDTNGDMVIDYGTNRIGDTGDKKIIGNSAAHYTYTINVNADWKNIFLSAFFQGVGKQQWWPGSEASLFWGQYNRPYNPLPKWQLGNYWTPENTNASAKVCITSGKQGWIYARRSSPDKVPPEYCLPEIEEYPDWLQSA